MLIRRQQDKLDFGPELKTWANSLHEIILASATLQGVTREGRGRYLMDRREGEIQPLQHLFSVYFQGLPLHSNNSNTRIVSINDNKNDKTTRNPHYTRKKSHE